MSYAQTHTKTFIFSKKILIYNLESRIRFFVQSTLSFFAIINNYVIFLKICHDKKIQDQWDHKSKIDIKNNVFCFLMQKNNINMYQLNVCFSMSTQYSHPIKKTN
ncbi:hypothetical protein EDEG_01753 [Edhazardia aedis USNM 41457]|uniref:Transmembrane protein n=1 Tax=Edhazardia aedis (strain USNM 41457) TaxID=1003232 RepID=J9DN29_EDHAE|nr:hypothetical protein EDEG_01753 [Edhazardia aedis USNM 41457]|eukprot:EJW03960.1 hypothetical protein EDEG_01753 [Edhazardia aedis USNM 41457]